MSFPKYERYKDSGVEWLGEVPERWSVKPLKQASTFNDDVIDDSTPAEVEIEYVDISSVQSGVGIVKSETLEFGDAPSRARRRVAHGDTIVSTVRTYLRAIAPVQNPVPNLIVSTGFAVVRPAMEMHPGYLGFVLSSAYFIESVVADSVGVSYPGINASDLVRIPVPLPSHAEQSTIAAFLDHETAKIDALVDEQRRLIELLKEKRQAVISHAVTKGLNPDAPMKDSGVEWLGEVPEHWEAVPNKVMMSNGKQLVGESWSTTPLLSLTKKGVILRDIESGHGKYPADFGTYQKVSKGDVVFCLFDIDETPCTVGISKHHGMITGAYTVLSCNAEASAEFVTYFYLHVDSHKGLRPYYTGLRKVVRPPTFMSIKMPQPPLNDQIAIASFLDQETGKIDALVVETDSVITLLQERRTALVSAAVTGKIDVRNHSPIAEGVPA